ncbi:MAG: ABC transporter permease [Anaerolineae bacterium]|nr:ABC transporter permease [Anaerolineae bacterium]MCA9889019.1 ABC transporter permease [Anaerolineae bacterium]MCA9894279.1 ABC transporter permease [Anaerolineae bacterium]MCB9460760.1 ABC transporter permease [Anaerolineaceae bacterium]
MGRFIARRILWMFLVLFVVSLVTFFLMRAVPGGPFDKERDFPDSVIENIEARFGLDQPLIIQYLRYIGQIVVPTVTEPGPPRSTSEDYLFTINLPGGESALRWMNFGPSLVNRSRSVTDMFRENLGVTFQLGIAAIIVAVAIGLPAGIVAALNRNTIWDYVGMGIATVGVSVTAITLGPFLQYLLGVELKLLPISGWGTAAHYIMPAFTLGFAQAAIIARLTRASLLQVLNEDYIRTARAKGLNGRRILWMHVLKNGMIPVVTVLGPITAFLVTGSFVTEQIFAIPGIGRAYVQSIGNRDYTLIMGTTLLFAFVLVLANTIVDISYGWLDPRIRYE